MNYDHAFHAGGFSDVLKHSVFSVCIKSLCAKDKPFRVIDAFAGTGLYDLKSEAAQRCPEWELGIAPFLNTNIPNCLEPFFIPYLHSIKRSNSGGALRHYPGSPELARILTRQQDRITLLEANVNMVPLLRKSMQKDIRISILPSDAWKATLGLLPPPEKRGIILIDPPFETPNELERLMVLMGNITKKWRNGIAIAWLPLKTVQEERFILSRLHTLSTDFGHRPETLYLKLQPYPYTQSLGGLAASALIIFNPPWDVTKQAEAALKFMTSAICPENAEHERCKFVSFPAA